MNETIMTEAIASGYVPSYFIPIVVFITLLAVLIFTKAYKGKKSWGNFWYVFGFSLLIGILTTLFLTLMPEITINLATKIGEFWANF